MFETQDFVFLSVNNLHEEGHSFGKKRPIGFFVFDKFLSALQHKKSYPRKCFLCWRCSGVFSKFQNELPDKLLNITCLYLHDIKLRFK